MLLLSSIRRVASTVCLACMTASAVMADDRSAASTRFIDIVSEAVDFKVDTAAQTIQVHAEVQFRLPAPLDANVPTAQVQPLLDLVPETTRYRIGTSGAWVDGDLPSVEVDRRTWRTLPHQLDTGKLYTLQTEYQLTRENTPRCRFECSVLPRGSSRKLISAVQFFNGQEIDASPSRADGVDFLMAVMDYDPSTYRTDGRTFFERYVPSGLESDQFAMSVTVDLTAVDRHHRVLANGSVEATPTGWRVDYPASSTCSSVYFHLLPVDRYVFSESIASVQQQQVPITVYSTQAAGQQFHDSVKDRPRQYIELLGGEIGFYPHDAFVAHMYPRSGGMEYSGATSCDPSALKHEIMHSWFGRGAHPADGNAGWIDEAVTYWWVDSQSAITSPLPNADTLFRRRPSELVTHNEYRRMTPSASYRQGGRFIGYVASVFKEHDVDLKLVLIDFLSQHLHSTYTNQQFLDHLTTAAPPQVDLEPAIAYFVYGIKTRSTDDSQP